MLHGMRILFSRRVEMGLTRSQVNLAAWLSGIEHCREIDLEESRPRRQRRTASKSGTQKYLELEPFRTQLRFLSASEPMIRWDTALMTRASRRTYTMYTTCGAITPSYAMQVDNPV